MFAGSLQGVTETLPVAIYQQFDIPPDGFTTALAMSALLVIVSGALLVALRVSLQWQPSGPTSRFLFAPSR
jgi:molybdate transport system permease protein